MLTTNDSAFEMKGFCSFRLLRQSKTSLTIAYYMSGAANPLSALSFNCQMTSFENYRNEKMNWLKHGIEFRCHHQRVLSPVLSQFALESTAFHSVGV